MPNEVQYAFPAGDESDGSNDEAINTGDVQLVHQVLEYGRSRMTSLMLVSRDGYSQVINLLVSHGAEVNSQDENGYTVLTVAVQYGREEPVLKLLQLGIAADIDKVFKRPQVNTNGTTLTRNDNSLAKLCDIELLLHGINLEYQSDIMVAGEFSRCSYCILPQIGISNPEDQQKVLSVVKEMHLDRVDLDTVSQLENINSGSEELYKFLISLRQQCCYLTETVQDVISRFPPRASELVLSQDPKNEGQAIYNELVAQTGDLQKEVTCLRNLAPATIFLLSLLGHSERMNESPVSVSSIWPCTPFHCPLFPSGPIPNFSQTRVNSHFAPSLCVGSCV
uniref:Uncharacterized protein n=1 Tax=Hucho hucho TaxID=62062 RepID=A0A4W5RAR1_9TELE